MNKVILMGRLTRDSRSEVFGERRFAGTMCIARYTLAVDRRGKDAGTDFPSVVAFGKAGEFAEKYLHKGTKIVLTGRIQTGSYTNRDGRKGIYNGYCGRGSRVCGKQGSSRTGTAGKRADGKRGTIRRTADGFMNITGRDRRRTAVHIGADGSRRQTYKATLAAGQDRKQKGQQDAPQRATLGQEIRSCI